jgi:spore maturation protein CgeB
MITPATVKVMTKSSQVMLFSGVSPVTFNSIVEQQYLPYITSVVTNDDLHTKQWLQLGAKKALTLPISAVDHEAIRSVKASPISSDMATVASLFADRQQQLVSIIKHLPLGIDYKIWGWLPPQEELSPELKRFYQGEAWGRDVIGIYKASKIGLNLSPTHMQYCGNLRVFEITASGSLLLTNQLNQEWFKANSEAMEFTSVEKVGEIATKILKDPVKLKQISTAGQKRTYKEHTYTERFKKLFKLIG